MPHATPVLERLPALVLLVLVACLGSCALAPPLPADLAIRDVTLIDAASRPRPGKTLLVRDGRIDAIVAAGTPVQAGLSIDGGGRFLIPGLTDLHVHITYEPALIEAMPALFLDYGVTSVRDTGGLLHRLLPEINRWRSGAIEAPKIWFSGPLLDGAKVVYDGADRPEIGIANATPESARASIRTLHEAGVDFVKLYELVAPEVFEALVQAARERELPIAAHVPLSMRAETAGARVNSMEHLRNIELACTDDADALQVRRTRRLAEAGSISGYALRAELHRTQRERAFAALDLQSANCQRVIGALRNTLQVPTLRLNTIRRYQPSNRPDWHAALAALPDSVENRWRRDGERFAAAPPPGNDAWELGNWSLALVSALHRAGVPIGAGTDTPIGQAIPGYSLHTELERLVTAGLTPREALAAATLRAAEFFGLQNEMGRLAAGHRADLVLLDANPLEDIRHTRAIHTVIAAGEVVRSPEG